jgi:Ca-activated chloride channel family protein
LLDAKVRRALLGGLDGVEATGGTALNDHLYLALKRLEERKGRRVLILLSDGVDSHSALPMRDVAWLARRSRALIYWVRTDPRQGEGMRYSAWKGAQEYKDEEALLAKTVTETGGRIVTLDRIEEAEAAMRGILQELREQYVLGYYPSVIKHDGNWHDVDVRVNRGGIRLRHRDGYIDY